MSSRKHENPITLRLRGLPAGVPVKALAVAILFAILAAPGAEAAVGVPGAHARVAVSDDGPPSFSEILAKARKNGTARVIVEFKEPASVSRGSQAYVDAVRATQAAIITEAFRRSAADLKSDRSPSLMKYSPMFAINATAAELERLSRDRNVIRIHLDELSSPSLLQSLGLTKMTGNNGAYALGATGKNRAVAILDTGVVKKHEFLKGKVISEACFNSNNASFGATSRCPGGVTESTASGSGADCDPAVIDGCGHGTHLAGIAAGKNTGPSSGEPNNGVAKDAGVVAINVFSRFNKASGNCGGGAAQDCVLSFTSDQMKALERVLDLSNGVAGHTIDSVNMSIVGAGFLGFCNDHLLKPVIDQLRKKGIATVIASGNDGYINAVTRPGCIETAITVGASTKKDSGDPERMAFYTNEGPQVDTLAPGGDNRYPNGVEKEMILSSYFKGYDTLQGTSMATPHVAGAIAAIRSKPSCANKSVSQIENALHKTGRKITDHRIVPGYPQLRSRRIDVPAVMKFLGCS